MASKKDTPGKDHLIPAATYTKMLATMRELTFRSAEHEATVLRIAKAGGISEAVAEITKLRKYVKAHVAAAAQSNSAGEDTPPRPSRGTRRKRTRRSGEGAGEGEGAGAGA